MWRPGQEMPPSRDHVQRKHQAGNCGDPGSNYSYANKCPRLIEPVAQPSNATTRIEQCKVCTDIAAGDRDDHREQRAGSGVETIPKKSPPAPATAFPEPRRARLLRTRRPQGRSRQCAFAETMTVTGSPQGLLLFSKSIL